MIKGRLGSLLNLTLAASDPFAASFLLVRRDVDDFSAGNNGSNRKTAGTANKILSRIGADEYSVKANKMAQTLRRKSAIKATGVTGVNKD